MLGIQIYVDVQQAELIPTPKNILNEIDSFSIPLGIERYQGERTRYFKQDANKIAGRAYHEPDQQHLNLGLELRSKSEFMLFECTSTSSKIIQAEVLDDFKFRVITFKSPSIVSTDLFQSSTSTYDLLDRCSYPFLEELLADATRNIEGIRTYISPAGHKRYNHILPYHLVPIQKNYTFGVAPAIGDTSFYLPHRFIVPNTLEASSGNLPSTIRIRFVQSTNDVTAPGDIHVDFWTGKVTTHMVYDTSSIVRKYGIVSALDGTSLSKFNVSFSYQYASPISRFVLTPGSTIINYTDTSILTRINTYDDPDCEIKKHRYQQADMNIQEGYMYSGSRISNNLAFVFQNGNLQDFNLNRWG